MAIFRVFVLMCVVALVYAQEEKCREYMEKTHEALKNMNDDELPKCYVENKDKWEAMNKEKDGKSLEECFKEQVEMWKNMSKEEAVNTLECMQEVEKVIVDGKGLTPPEECEEMITQYKEFIQKIVDEKR